MATAQETKETRDPKRTAVWIARALTYFAYAWAVINEFILIIGFTLLLFGANPDAGFTQWAYRNLDRVMEPFRGIFTAVPVGTGSGDVQPVLDTSILFAMLIYAIIALALRSLIDWLAYRLAKIDAQRAQEEADAKLAAEQELRAQQVAALAAANAQTNPVEASQTTVLAAQTTPAVAPQTNPTGPAPMPPST